MISCRNHSIEIVSWWSLTENKKIKISYTCREIIKYIRQMILYSFDNLGLPVKYTVQAENIRSWHLKIYGPLAENIRVSIITN